MYKFVASDGSGMVDVLFQEVLVFFFHISDVTVCEVSVWISPRLDEIGFGLRQVEHVVIEERKKRKAAWWSSFWMIDCTWPYHDLYIVNTWEGSRYTQSHIHPFLSLSFLWSGKFPGEQSGSWHADFKLCKADITDKILIRSWEGRPARKFLVNWLVIRKTDTQRRRGRRWKENIYIFYYFIRERERKKKRVCRVRRSRESVWSYFYCRKYSLRRSVMFRLSFHFIEIRLRMVFSTIALHITYQCAHTFITWRANATLLSSLSITASNSNNYTQSFPKVVCQGLSRWW